MNHWLSASLVSLFSFGLWGLFSKIAVGYVDSKSVLVYQTGGVALVGVLALLFMDFKPTMDVKGFSYGMLTGMAYAIGCLFFFIAASKGRIVTVVTLTALYPLITILFSYIFFNEVITAKQGIGIFLAVLSIIFLSL